MPHTEGPVLGTKPLTPNVPLNVALGGVVAAVPNAGYGVVMQGVDPLGAAAVVGTSAILNVVAQPLKNIKWLPEHELLPIVLLAIAFGIGFLIFRGEEVKAILNAGCSTVTAIGNYKADKLAGTNLLQPASPENEFRGVKNAVRF